MNENGGEAFNWTIRALSELNNENYREAKKFLRWALEALEESDKK